MFGVRCWAHLGADTLAVLLPGHLEVRVDEKNITAVFPYVGISCEPEGCAPPMILHSSTLRLLDFLSLCFVFIHILGSFGEFLESRS